MKSVKLVVTHVSEFDITTYFVNVKKIDSAARLTGTYGDLEEEPNEDVSSLIKQMGLKYDTSVDNLEIRELPKEGEFTIVDKL